MTRHFPTHTRLMPAMAFFGVGVIVSAPAMSDSNRVISVEEHWELHLAQPDVGSSAPQTTMVMSPTGDLNDNHFLFTLNHSSAPNTNREACRCSCGTAKNS